MLAEARRKIKYSFDPRNTNWTNDDNKFGQKLMEKMGWSKGRGLGVKEDGNPTSIAVSLKNDTRGVGWNKNQEDNWIAHQDDFNDLLSSLNANHGTGGDSSDENKTHKVQKLEQTSRTAKGRVHYQKFAKGKDLSLRSETDLDCVFGKRKSKKRKSEIEEISEQKESDESDDKEDTTEDSGGLITVTSTDSVQDYFAKKMAAIKNKRNGVSDTTDATSGGSREELMKSCEMETNCTEPGDNNSEIVKKKKKKKKQKREDDMSDSFSDVKQDSERVSFALGGGDDDDNDEDNDNTEQSSNSNIIASNKVDNVSRSKSKRNKKNLKVRFCLENEDELEELNDSVGNKEELSTSTVDDVQIENSSPKQKKKKSKKRKLEMEDNDMDIVTENIIDQTVTEKVLTDSGIDDTAQVQGITDIESKSKRKNKKKRKNNDTTNDEIVTKKMKIDCEIVQEISVDNAVPEDVSNKKKKSKKKKKADVKEVSEDRTEETTDNQADVLPMEPVDVNTEIVNPFQTNPEKILMEYASTSTEEIRFVLEKEGQQHRPIFKMHVEIGARTFQPVQSRTKKDAKKKAAIVAVIALSEDGKLESLGLKAPVSEEVTGAVQSNTSTDDKEVVNTDFVSEFEGSSLNAVKGYPGLPHKSDNFSKPWKRY